jgi:hypothetical protein
VLIDCLICFLAVLRRPLNKGSKDLYIQRIALCIASPYINGVIELLMELFYIEVITRIIFIKTLTLLLKKSILPLSPPLNKVRTLYNCNITYNALIYITLRLHRKVVSITRKVTSLGRGQKSCNRQGLTPLLA